GILRRLLARLNRRGLQKTGNHGGQHFHMRDLFRADVEDHVAILGGCAAVPALEEVSHHDTDLAPLAAKNFLKFLCVDRIRPLRLCMILKLVGAEKHRTVLAYFCWGEALPTSAPLRGSAGNASGPARLPAQLLRNLRPIRMFILATTEV